MAQLGQTFDINELPQSTVGNYDPLPEGNYDATITSAELMPTKDGTGQYIKLRLDITGPSHQGRVVFSNINIRNASAKAEEIGRQQLGELMRAIGLARVQDTDQLIGANINVKLTVREARTDPASGKTYGASNEVRAYRAINGAAAMPQAASKPFGAPSAAPSAAPAQSAKAAPPWMAGKK